MCNEPYRQAANANLSEVIQDNREDIRRNWWDNYNLSGRILGNRGQVRTDQQPGPEKRTGNTGLHQQIHKDILLRQANNAPWQEIPRNTATPHTDHDLIRSER